MFSHLVSTAHVHTSFWAILVSTANMYNKRDSFYYLFLPLIVQKWTNSHRDWKGGPSSLHGGWEDASHLCEIQLSSGVSEAVISRLKPDEV